MSSTVALPPASNRTSGRLLGPVRTVPTAVAHAPRRVVADAVRVPSLLWREARPAVQVVFALRLVVGATVAVGPAAITRARTDVLLVSWVALAVAVYVFNGLTDVAGDRRNGSGRPLASGALSPQTAAVAVVVLATSGLLGCAVDDRDALVPAVLFLLLGWAYSAGPSLKARPCGFAVVIGVGAALTYAAGWSLDPTRPACLGAEAAIAAWVGTTCAAKDFSDVDGDRAAGRRTWPVVLGPERAALVVSATALLTAGAAVALGLLATAVLPAALVLLAGSAVLAVRLHRCVGRASGASGASTPDPAVRVDRRRPYRAFLATQYAANAVVLAGIVGVLAA